jgi:hypothetical protein
MYKVTAITNQMWLRIHVYVTSYDFVFDDMCVHAQVFASPECMGVIRGLYDEKRRLELKYKHFPPKVRGLIYITDIKFRSSSGIHDIDLRCYV